MKKAGKPKTRLIDISTMPKENYGPVELVTYVCQFFDDFETQCKIVNHVLENDQIRQQYTSKQAREIWKEISIVIDKAIRDRYGIQTNEQGLQEQARLEKYACLQFSTILIVDGFKPVAGKERSRSMTARILSWISEDLTLERGFDRGTVDEQLNDARARLQEMRSQAEADAQFDSFEIDDVADKASTLSMKDSIKGYGRIIYKSQVRPSAVSTRHNKLLLTYFVLAKHYLKLRPEESSDAQIETLRKLLAAKGIQADPLMLIAQFEEATERVESIMQSGTREFET